LTADEAVFPITAAFGNASYPNGNSTTAVSSACADPASVAQQRQHGQAQVPVKSAPSLPSAKSSDFTASRLLCQPITESGRNICAAGVVDDSARCCARGQIVDEGWLMSRHRPYIILLVCAVLTARDVGPASRFAAAQQVAVGGNIQTSGVQWQYDLESAKRAAAQTGRLVLVHFWTPTCKPCLKLEEAVFNQPGVGGALQAQFVPVKLNANEHPDIAQSFGITHLPTDVIMTAEGQVVGKQISPPTPAAYVAETTQLARQYTTRLGGPFAQATATESPRINTAYAGLQIPANTPAALEAQAATLNPHRFAAAANPFTANAPTPTAASLTPVPPPPTAAVAPVATSQPSQYDQFPQPSGAVPAVQAMPPRQIANPYAAPPTTGPSPQASPVAAATSQPSSPADPRSPAPNAAPIGFDGYCPVSMRTQWKWVPGVPRYGIVHRGRTYLMAGPAEQQQFWADPDRYSPALSGMDPVLAIDHAQQVPGKREHSIDYHNLFYMFASEATLQQFTSTPERYAVAVRQAMGIQRGRLVR
jgi:thiol-disulfide isomerase/thioredoxin/YHS domain-containing protein